MPSFNEFSAHVISDGRAATEYSIRTRFSAEFQRHEADCYIHVEPHRKFKLRLCHNNGDQRTKAAFYVHEFDLEDVAVNRTAYYLRQGETTMEKSWLRGEPFEWIPEDSAGAPSRGGKLEIRVYDAICLGHAPPRENMTDGNEILREIYYVPQIIFRINFRFRRSDIPSVGSNQPS
ncbi:hypothetical protein ABKN59_009724 [Abortiporus biennis]